MYVFIAKIIDGKLKSSREGTPKWIIPSQILIEELAFPHVHIKILEDYLRYKGSGKTLRAQFSQTSHGKRI